MLLASFGPIQATPTLRGFMVRLISFLAYALSAGGVPAFAETYDEPKSTLVMQEGRFSVRDYSPLITASVIVEREGGQAYRAGFGPLLAYITGDNRLRDQIAMTVPVTRQSAQIAMTVPVTREPSRSGLQEVSFVMPSDWTLETLPVPNNAAVRIREIPARRIASMTFPVRRGFGDGLEQAERLKSWIETRGFTILEGPIYAIFDSPYGRAASGRLNEVQFVIENSGGSN